MFARLIKTFCYNKQLAKQAKIENELKITSKFCKIIDTLTSSIMQKATLKDSSSGVVFLRCK